MKGSLRRIYYLRLKFDADAICLEKSSVGKGIFKCLRGVFDAAQIVCLFVWCLTTHQPLWVISVKRY